MTAGTEIVLDLLLGATAIALAYVLFKDNWVYGAIFVVAYMLIAVIMVRFFNDDQP